MLRSTASKVMWVGTGRMFALLLGVMVALVLGYATKAYAAPGYLDPSFDTDGKANTDFVYEYTGLALALQEDGKAIVAGSSYNASRSAYEITLARYDADGALDPSFGGDGIVTTPIGPNNSYDRAEAVAVRADGKIVVAGRTYNAAAGGSDFAVVCYDANGALDPSFGGDGIVTTSLSGGTGWDDDTAYGLAVHGQKILVAGTTYNGDRASGGTEQDFALLRYDDDGDLDTTFGSGGVVETDFYSGTTDNAHSVVVQDDGKIVVAGSTYNLNSTAASPDFALARYDANGVLDTTFNADGKTTTDFAARTDAAHGVALQENGKIVVAGHAYIGTSYDFAVARYNPNGFLDGEFDFDGRATVDFGSSVISYGFALQDDGKMVLAGRTLASAEQSDLALARLNDDGSLNASFHNDGRLSTDFFNGNDEASAVALQEDGKIVAAGSAKNGSNRDFAIARYFGGEDATRPVVKPPVQSLITNSTLGTSDVPVRLAWSATDSEGVITDYDLQRSTDGGAYQNIALPSATTRAVTHLLSPTHNYRYRVRATDDNGNTSSFKYGPRFTVDAHQESSTAIAYSGTWRQQSVSGSYGGAVKYATASGATAKLAFTGTNVAWVAPKSNARGRAEVYLDGVKVATVDLYSSTALSRRVIYSASGLNPSVTHTLQIKVLGTKKASSSGTRVDVDAFVVLR